MRSTHRKDIGRQSSTTVQESAGGGAERLRREPLGHYRYVRLRWRVVFAVIDFVGESTFGIVRALWRALRWVWRGRTAPAATDPQVILLVQLDHLGDAILTTSMLPTLRRRFPGATIEVLASQAARHVFATTPEVSRIHVARVNRFARSRWARLAWIWAMIGWGLALRRRRIDLAIDVRGDFPAALILWLCGAQRRLGWTCGGGGFLLTETAPYVPGRPEIESRRMLAKMLGVGAVDAATCRPRLIPSVSARQRIASQLQPNRGHGPLVVVHVGAGTPAKRWPVVHWQRVVAWLVAQRAARVVLVGNSSEWELAEQVRACLPWPMVRNWAGRLSLDQLSALLAAADLMVGADSGPAHAAAAVDTSAVVLFSGTNEPQQWQPPGSNVKVLRHSVECSPCHRQRCPLAGHPCMRQLEPHSVMAAIEEVLDGRGRAELAFCDGIEQ